MGAPQSPPQPRLGAAQFHSRLLTSLTLRRCSPWMGYCTAKALNNPCRHSMAWICAPQFDSALLHHHQHSPCPPRARHQALLHSWWHTSSSPEFIILPFNLQSDSPQPNLNLKPFGYHQSSQTTLEFNFTHSPGPNHSEIHGAPPASLHH